MKVTSIKKNNNKSEIKKSNICNDCCQLNNNLEKEGV